MKRKFLWQAPLLALVFSMGWLARGSRESHPSESEADTSSSRARGISANASFQNIDRETRADEFLNSTDKTKNELWLQALVSEWAREDLAEALAFAREHDRKDLIRIALQETRTDNLTTAQDWLATQEGRDAAHDRFLILQGLAKNDPEKALAQVNKIMGAEERKQALGLVFQEWARQDTDSFFSWIAQQEVTPELELGYRKAMTALIENNPAENAYLIEAMDDGELKSELRYATAESWAKRNPQAAKNWVTAQLATANPKEKQLLLTSLMDGWVQHGNAKEALNFLEQHRGEEGYATLFHNAVSAIAYRDPEALRTRFGNMTPEEQQAGARPLAEALIRQQSPETNAWLQSLPVGAVKDQALAVIAPSLQTRDPARAITLAGQITNPGERMYVFHDLVNELAATSPEQARELVSQVDGLGEFERASLIESIKKAGSKSAPDLLLPEN